MWCSGHQGGQTKGPLHKYIYYLATVSSQNSWGLALTAGSLPCHKPAPLIVYCQSHLYAFRSSRGGVTVPNLLIQMSLGWFFSLPLLLLAHSQSRFCPTRCCWGLTQPGSQKQTVPQVSGFPVTLPCFFLPSFLSCLQTNLQSFIFLHIKLSIFTCFLFIYEA